MHDDGVRKVGMTKVPVVILDESYASGQSGLLVARRGHGR
jgi:hypothetical protein